ncbi:hypothetical protein [Candidatus Puniceispirillum marinum]|uniref:Uncharacterized protein n=1 Tax=Puniceispirillum marinum (strain IMCC1322) TaxID=488538 RepID=D5BQ60_PUNMI|nr:hypothetical protein [Candidatus Puniceispirillum marinum]ADE38558.1 hypothetical protein SAR116_0315 [Candidatus Puniceispirillum marinum IMCC1322]
MHGRALSDHVLKHCHFMKTLIVFIFMTIYATNAVGWGWSRSPGQASSVSTPSNDTGTTVTSDATSSPEAASSTPMSQDIQQSTPTAPSQDVQNIETETVADQATADTANQATQNAINQDKSNSGNDNSDNQPILTKRAKRKNMLIKKWRAEFARDDVYYVVTGKPLDIPDVKFQLDRIQYETPEFPRNQLPFKGSDLALLEEWVNDSLDRRISQNLKSQNTTSPLSTRSKLDANDVRKKIADLETKREMLVYGNNALQAMGIYID